jgi:hypothetical protein
LKSTCYNVSGLGKLKVINSEASVVEDSRLVIIILIFLSVVILLSNSGLPVQAVGQVRVLNDQGLVDESCAYHILGEVENAGDTPVTAVNITATGYSQLGEVLANSSTIADLIVIMPNEKSPFDVVLTYFLTENDVANYSLSISYSAANSVSRTLRILSNASYTDSSGILYVDGSVTNVGTGVAANVRVIATFYDSDGHVVWVNEEYSEPHDVLSGANASFEVLVPDYSVVPLVTSYALTPESFQQPIVPESSYFPVLPLAIALTIIISALLAVIVYMRHSYKTKQSG